MARLAPAAPYRYARHTVAAVKLVKPDPAIFEYICRQHQLEPSETIFVDDHSPNIEGAEKLGFRTILVPDAERCAQDLNTFLGNSAERA
jgi:putative hydrolase of the HAD superfamily